jgi:hypothetical protein
VGEEGVECLGNLVYQFCFWFGIEGKCPSRTCGEQVDVDIGVFFFLFSLIFPETNKQQSTHQQLSIQTN